jgi:hypothetical protein
MRALALILLLAAAPALADEEPVPVRAQAGCRDGKLVAVRIFAPGAGVITVAIPEKPCEPQKDAPPPEPEKQPARSV